MPIAYALRHIAFEHLGGLALILVEAGYRIESVDAPRDELGRYAPSRADLVVVLGGPLGAYECDRYPFLAAECRLIERAMTAGARVLGICLGGQLIARTLGARIHAGSEKEIGFTPLQLTEAGQRSSLTALEGVDVLHWHGDTYDCPTGATRLASTGRYVEQAFAFGDRVLAMQFHPEVLACDFEQWLVGHAVELAQAQVDVVGFRATAAEALPMLVKPCANAIRHWLNVSPTYG